MVGNGYAREFAERCFQQIEGFGAYGFPESHAASFALLVYVSAWLKCHYPAAFACALLNSQPMGFYAPAQIVRDARDHGVTVLPVDVNASDWDCTLEPEQQAASAGPPLPSARSGSACDGSVNDMSSDGSVSDLSTVGLARSAAHAQVRGRAPAPGKPRRSDSHPSLRHEPTVPDNGKRRVTTADGRVPGGDQDRRLGEARRNLTISRGPSREVPQGPRMMPCEEVPDGLRRALGGAPDDGVESHPQLARPAPGLKPQPQPPAAGPPLPSACSGMPRGDTKALGGDQNRRLHEARRLRPTRPQRIREPETRALSAGLPSSSMDRARPSTVRGTTCPPAARHDRRRMHRWEAAHQLRTNPGARIPTIACGMSPP